MTTSERTIKRFRAWRQMEGLSADAAARLLTTAGWDVRRTTLANIESGRRVRLVIEEAEVMADVMGVSFQDLTSEDPLTLERAAVRVA